MTCSVVTATDGLYPTRPEVPLQLEPLPIPAIPFATWGNRSLAPCGSGYPPAAPDLGVPA